MASVKTNKIISNISHLIFENILKLGVGFFVSVWVARSLGPENYGFFNYVISFAMIFSPFYIMGVDDVAMKEFVGNTDQHNRIIGSGALVKLTGGLIGLILCSISIYVVGPENPLIISGVILYSTIQLIKCFDIISIWYLTNIEAKRVTLIRNIVLIISSLFKVYFLMNKYSWEWFVYVSCLDAFIVGVFYILTYFKDNRSIFQWEYHKETYHRFLKLSFPIFLIALFTIASGRIDQIMIAEFLGAEVLGKYAVVVKLVDLWQFVPIAFVTSLFPGLIAAKKKGFKKYYFHNQMILSLMVWLGLLFAVGVFFFGEWIVQKIYGDAYADSGNLLILYAWLAIFNFITFARSKIFLLQNRINDGVILALFNLVINIGLNIYLIPMHGALGAIWASVYSYIVSNFVLSLIHKNIRRSCFDIIKSILFPIKLLTKSN